MDLPIEINKFESIKNLYDLVTKDKVVDLTNVKGGLQGFIALSVFDQSSKDNRNTLLVFPTEIEARQKFNVIKRYNEDVLFFPAEQVHYYFSDAYSNYEHIERQQTLSKILSDKPYLVICSIEALLKKLPAVEFYESGNVELKVGEEFGFDTLIEKLRDFGYERSYQTEAPGQYSVRGEIIDVFIPTQKQPVRIDFFDNEIETIKYFNAFTQRSDQELDKVTLLPANENWLPSEEAEEARSMTR